MPNVLMVSYLFPPMGGVGVQRTLKFVKYLPDFGWYPNVLTSKTQRHVLLDQDLVNQVPSSTPIYRTGAAVLPHRLPWRLRDWITRWFLAVDEQVGWYPFAIRAGLRILRENPVEMIYSSSSPYTSHLVARHLAAETHIPWVADFRDPWIGNFNLHFPTSVHRKFVENLERQVLQDASHVLVASPAMMETFSNLIPAFDKSKATWLPNGYDGEDFKNVQTTMRAKDRFYLVYTGSFYSQGLTARPILEAVQSVTQSGVIPRSRICLRLVGNIGKFSLQSIDELNLGDVVETTGFVSHAQSIAHLMAADALLLVIGDAPNSAAIYTGKVFEYLAAGKPILCLANDGAAADLVRDAKAGTVVSPVDVPQISSCLVEMYHQWEAGVLRIESDRQLIQTFERRVLAGKLATIFDDVSDKTR